MLRSSIVRTVDLCVRRPWWTIVLALALAAGSGVYAVRHFAIHTDIRDLFSPDTPWAQRARQYQKEFPQWDILVVLDAPTPELVEQAANKLATALAAHPERFRAVSHPGSGSFFEQNGLLFLSTDEVRQATDGLTRAEPLIGTLAGDPSLRGSLDALSLAQLGVERGDIQWDHLVGPLQMAATTVEAALAGRPASFSWRLLASGRPADANDGRRFLEVAPVLDFSALEPGRPATNEIARIASDLNLAQDYQARLRLTGPVPMNDDQFGTVRENSVLNAVVSLLIVFTILWLALRSARIVFAAALSVFVGISIATAVGLFLVGALNLISIAFFALFVGLGIDFCIQFSVRYRAERYDYPDLLTALRSAAKKAGGPLALAAVATAVGFGSFLPTNYRGLSELGLIAGIGMIIAFITSVTLLPALLAVLNPPGERHPVGFAALAPIDRFLERHRMPVIVGTLLVVVLASPLLLILPFDFNPLHLQNPKLESVATYLELRSNPQTGVNAIEIVSPNVAAADAQAKRIAALPQVAQARTISSLVPEDQDTKIDLIGKAAAAIDESLNQDDEPAPSDAETVKSLTSTAEQLANDARDQQGDGPEAARRLSGLLLQVAKADVSIRKRLEAAVVEPLLFSLDQLRSELHPQRITVDTIPPDLARQWVAADGRARIQVLPNGDPDNTDTLRSFVKAVLAVEPNAAGPADLLYEAGNTVLRAFIEAAMFALVAIFILLLITLRRLRDVLLTLVPLLVAGFVTLELCAVLDFPLNFANILALPLLLGVGVAFKIYYIMAWRSGKTRLLESSLTRAVLFSGMTTATAFGSLWLSSHPGMSSMGKLMALALVCTMAAAVLFQPVLMGPPPTKGANAN